MTLRTVTEAKALHCPIARIRGEDKPPARCIGPTCMLWRYAPLLMDDPRVQSAIVREVGFLRNETKGDEKPPADLALHKRAVARVNAAPDRYVIRDETDKGFCGIGGAP